jgi:membrane protease YdiL (CAAX protease family)
MRATASPFTRGVIIAIAFLYVVAFVIVVAQIGPWEATRQVAVQGLIVILWLWVAHRLLGDMPTGSLPIKRPGLELSLGLAGLAATAALAVAAYQGLQWSRWALTVLDYGLPIGVFILLGYGIRAAGLVGAPKRAWGAVLAVIVINLVVSLAAGRLLPPGELAGPAGYDLAAGIRGPLDLLLALGSLLLFAAIPEELYLRVYLQPRLARFVPLGWAILFQTILFNAAHLPQQILGLGHSWPPALAFTVLTPANGLIAGYLWWKTRSLPLLVVLHMFAYARIGM